MAYPVTLDELKRNLHLPVGITDDPLDSDLQQVLDAAHQYGEKFTGLNFQDGTPAEFPPLLRHAVLITASYFFRQPVDTAYTIPTQAQHLFKQFQVVDYGR